MMMPTGSILILNPAQSASAATSSKPRLWLKLKPIQACHLFVRPPDSLRAELAIACATEGSTGTRYCGLRTPNTPNTAPPRISRVAIIGDGVVGLIGGFASRLAL